MFQKITLAIAFLGLCFGGGLLSVIAVALLLDTFKLFSVSLSLLLAGGVILFVVGILLGLKMFSDMGLI